MQTDRFNKSTNQLKTSELTPGLSLNVYQLLFKIHFPLEETSGVFTSRTQMLHFVLTKLRCVTFRTISGGKVIYHQLCNDY